jgi:hypothetical protein
MHIDSPLTTAMSSQPKQSGALPKCDMRYCKNTGVTFPCANTDCIKLVHEECYLTLLATLNLERLSDNGGEVMVVVCTKACYLKVSTTGKKDYWNRDGPKGRDDPNNSERILLDWLLVPGNYDKYRGEGNHGKNKLAYCQDISDLIAAAGCQHPRDKRKVKCKIEYLEKAFRSGYAWKTSETGEGLAETDNVTYKQKLYIKCEHFDELEPIMAPRSATCPEMTSADFDNDDDMSSVSEDSPHSSPRRSPRIHSTPSQSASQAVQGSGGLLSPLRRSPRLASPRAPAMPQPKPLPVNRSLAQGGPTTATTVGRSSPKSVHKEKKSASKVALETAKVHKHLLQEQANRKREREEDRKEKAAERRARLEEEKRHNLKMEEVAEAQVAATRAQSDTLEYRLKIIDEYESFRAKYANTFTAAEVTHLVPDFERVGVLKPEHFKQTET